MYLLLQAISQRVVFAYTFGDCLIVQDYKVVFDDCQSCFWHVGYNKLELPIMLHLYYD